MRIASTFNPPQPPSVTHLVSFLQDNREEKLGYIMAAVATSSSVQVVDTDLKLRLAGASDKPVKT